MYSDCNELARDTCYHLPKHFRHSYHRAKGPSHRVSRSLRLYQRQQQMELIRGVVFSRRKEEERPGTSARDERRDERRWQANKRTALLTKFHWWLQDRSRLVRWVVLLERRQASAEFSTTTLTNLRGIHSIVERKPVARIVSRCTVSVCPNDLHSCSTCPENHTCRSSCTPISIFLGSPLKPMKSVTSCHLL